MTRWTTGSWWQSSGAMRKRVRLPQDSKLHCLTQHTILFSKTNHSYHYCALYWPSESHCIGCTNIELHCSATPRFQVALYCISTALVHYSDLHCIVSPKIVVHCIAWIPQDSKLVHCSHSLCIGCPKIALHWHWLMPQHSKLQCCDLHWELHCNHYLHFMLQCSAVITLNCKTLFL